MSILSKAHFHDEEAAFKKVEALLWPDGPVCPYCGGKDRVYVLEGVRSKPSKKNPEGVMRYGLKKCGHCRKQFTIRVKTIFESSHIPLHKWLQAIHLLCASKKGISSHQLHRILEITYEAAWFMSHRIREAMRTGSLAPMGGPGSIYQIDETFIGQKQDTPKKRGYGHKHAALALVERGGEVRTFQIGKNGWIYSKSVPIEDVAAMVAVVASASRDAAKALVSLFREKTREDWTQELARMLHREFGANVRREVKLAGESNKNHKFDFVVRLPNMERLVIDAVKRDGASMNSAIVHHLDLRQSKTKNIVQRIVYNDQEDWRSADLALLEVGAPPVALSKASNVFKKLAA